MSGTFTLDLQRFAEKAGKKADDVVGAVVVNIAAKLDMRSPVGDAKYWKHPPPKGYIGGHFRANWQLGVDHRPTAEIPGVDPRGAKTLGTITASVPEAASGHVYWLANNAPYAQRLEHGWSRQAPEGMVGLTVTEFQMMVRRAVEATP